MKKRDVKNLQLVLRVTAQEKRDLKRVAKLYKYNKLSAYIRFCLYLSNEQATNKAR